ncbi:MAG: gliding motility lipoprotein GldH [Prevotella sp.]
MRRAIRYAGIVLIITAVVALTQGCNRSRVFSRYCHIDEEGWERTDTLRYTAYVSPLYSYTQPAEREALAERKSTCQSWVELRVHGDYPYQNVALVVRQCVPSQRKQWCDTLQCSLVNEKGVFNGHGVGAFQYRFPLRSMTLTDADSIEVHISHIMKKETLRGILDVGFALERMR